MTVGFYSAKTGMLSMQEGLDVVSNNIANISTTGYKELRPSFSDTLYTIQKEEYEQAQTGHGAKISKTDMMFKQGQLIMTNRPLDFAAPNEGFFAVKDANGDTKYTRDGSFHMSKSGEGWELANADGSKVLDYEGNPVKIEMKDGVINQEKLVQDVGVYTFSNPYGLLAGGSNCYMETESSGEAKADKELDKLNNVLENSTVDIADQMVKVIQYQRAFQLNSEMIRTNDEIESIVNNLR